MKIKITHPAPGKRGKQETREFAALDDAIAYVDRNTSPREHGRAPRLVTVAGTRAVAKLALDAIAKGGKNRGD